MTAPPASIAVIRAAIEDSALEEIAQRPGWTAQRIVAWLAAEGWDIVRREPPRRTAA